MMNNVGHTNSSKRCSHPGTTFSQVGTPYTSISVPSELMFIVGHINNQTPEIFMC